MMYDTWFKSVHVSLVVGGLPALTCKLNMKFIFWFENLDVKRAIWSKVFGSPSPQYSLMILEGKETVFFFFFKSHSGIASFVKDNLNFMEHKVCLGGS